MDDQQPAGTTPVRRRSNARSIPLLLLLLLLIVLCTCATATLAPVGLFPQQVNVGVEPLLTADYSAWDYDSEARINIDVDGLATEVAEDVFGPEIADVPTQVAEVTEVPTTAGATPAADTAVPSPPADTPIVQVATATPNAPVPTTTPAATGTPPLVPTVVVDTPTPTGTPPPPPEPEADLAITKSDGTGQVDPGEALEYVITVVNNGPTDVSGARIRDEFPGKLNNISWACSSSGGADCGGNSGSGDINVLADIPVGGRITLRAQATVRSDATGTVTNTASVSVPSGIVDPNTGNNQNSDTNQITSLVEADLRITNSNGTNTLPRGATTTYEVNVINPGPDNVNAARVTNTFSGQLINVTWTCQAANGASCGSSSGANAIDEVVRLPAQSGVRFTVTGTVSTIATGTISSVAAVNSGVDDPNPGNNSAIDTDNVVVNDRLDLDVDVGSTSSLVALGQDVTIRVSVNHISGVLDGTNVTVSDSLPAELTNVTWTCAGTGGASCPASGSGSIASTVDIPIGGAISYTISATIAPTATGTFSYSASIAVPPALVDTNSANNSDSTDFTIAVPGDADIEVTVTRPPTPVTGGDPVSVDIRVSHAGGPADAPNIALTDVLPPELTGVSWTCAPSSGASCPASGTGSLAGSIDLPVGGEVNYTLEATVATDVTTSFEYRVSAAVPASVTDANTANNTDFVRFNPPTVPEADLQIQVSGAPTNVDAGDPVSITVQIDHNGGTADALGATVSNTLPADLTNVSWTCSGTNGGTCPASGTGSIASTIDVPLGGEVIFQVQADIAGDAAGNFNYSASVTVPASILDPSPGNNSDSVSFNVTGQANLVVDVVASSNPNPVSPGQNVQLIVEFTNQGPADVFATITDVLPPELTDISWNCNEVSGGTCLAPSGTGSIGGTVALPSGSGIDFEVSATIDPGASGDFTYTATISPPGGITDTVPGNNSDNHTFSTTTLDADLIVIVNGLPSTVGPGEMVTISVNITNMGPGGDALGSVITDVLPAELTNFRWACSGTGGATCPALGTGSIAGTFDLPVNSTLSYSITADVAAGATGEITYSVTAATPAGVSDSDPSNNTGSVSFLTGADLLIVVDSTMTDVTPGGSSDYTITIENLGPSDVVNAPIVAISGLGQLANYTWTCTASGGASCGAASGTNVFPSGVDVVAGGVLTYDITGTIPASASGTFTIEYRIDPPAGVVDTDPSNNTSFFNQNIV